MPPGTGNAQGVAGTRGKRKRVGTENPLAKPQDANKRALYHCNYCRKDISSTVRIKCAVCADFDLCLECFSVGVKIWPHRNDHAYRVVDNLSFPLYHPDWGADEELLLLEAVDMYGMGNWPAVAEHVGTKKEEECRKHYFAIYVDSPSFPQPTAAPEMAAVDPLQVMKDRQKARQTDAQLQHAQAGNTAAEVAAQHLPEGASIAAAAAAAEADAAVTGTQASEQSKAESAAVPGADTEAEMSSPQQLIKTEPEAARPGTVASGRHLPTSPPERPQASAASDATQTAPGIGASRLQAGSGELEEDAGTLDPAAKKVKREPAAEAESAGKGAGARDALVAKVEPQQATADQPAGTRCLLRVTTDEDGTVPRANAPRSPGDPPPKVAGNQAELTGFHSRRCEFEPEYDNEAEVIIAELEFREEDSDSETAAKLRLVDTYNARLTERERRRAFITERGLLNVRRQQAAERRRQGPERELGARARALARYLPQPAAEALADGLIMEHRMRARIQELKDMRRAGVRTFTEAEQYEADRRKAGLAERGGSRRFGGRAVDELVQGQQGATAPLAATSSSAAAAAPRLVRPLGSTGSFTTADGKALAAALAAWRTRRGVALDITALPGTELLSSKERELCATARLLPSHYLALKAALMREAERRGSFVPRTDAKAYFRLDAPRALRVYDLLVSCGWLPAPPSALGISRQVAAQPQAVISAASMPAQAGSLPDAESLLPAAAAMAPNGVHADGNSVVGAAGIPEAMHLNAGL